MAKVVYTVFTRVCMNAENAHTHTLILILTQETNPEIRWKFCEDTTSFGWNTEVCYLVTLSVTNKQTERHYSNLIDSVFWRRKITEYSVAAMVSL